MTPGAGLEPEPETSGEPFPGAGEVSGSELQPETLLGPKAEM